jgi:ABC-type histidine transport system ATPase subunit
VKLSDPGSAAAPVVLHASGIRKSFGEIEVLQGLSLEARRGDVISLIGSSGSGKSTFLRCMNFLESPSAGDVLLDGVAIAYGGTGLAARASLRQIESLRRRVAMVFQGFNLWSHMTILENIIEAPIRVHKVKRAEAIEQAHALLAKVGLAQKASSYPAQLSGGQQQRAAIARALAVNPEVILFDEPTSALDPELVGEVLKVITELAQEGRTMIIVTHEMNFARNVSNKVVFLHQGMIEEEGTPDQVFGAPKSKRLADFLKSYTASASK